MTTTTVYQELTCCKCGIGWAVEYTFYQLRVRQERSIGCPNGHACMFKDTGERKPSDKEHSEMRRLKRQLVRAIHDNDQLQAKMESEVA